MIRNATDAGFAYWKCPIRGTEQEKAQRAAKHKVITLLPERTHDPVLLEMAVLSTTTDEALARRFLEFAVGSEGQELLAENGAPSVRKPGEVAAAEAPAELPTRPGTAAVPAWPQTGATPGAPVVIRGYFPLLKAPHKEEAALLRLLGEMFPHEVDAEMLDLTSERGYGLWQHEAGVTCGGIVVNGRDLHEIATPAGRRMIWFVHDLGGQWTEEDLMAVAREQVEQARSAPRSYRVVFQVKVRPPTGARITRVWVPKPPTTDYQAISDFTASPEPDKLGRESLFGNEFLYFERTGEATPLEITLRFRVKVAPRLSPATEPRETKASAIDESLQPYLRSEPAITVNATTRALAARLVKGKRSPYHQAKAIYGYVIKIMTYSKERCTIEFPCGSGRVEEVLDVSKGACADYQALFISLCRSAGIPARQVNGNWLRPDKTTPHCWAEVFLSPYGWIPVDVSYAATGMLDLRDGASSRRAKRSRCGAGPSTRQGRETRCLSSA